MSDEAELARDYQQARIDRRTLIRGLLAAGLTSTAAAAFAEALNPTAAGASPLASSAQGAAAGVNAPNATPIVTKLHFNAGPLVGGNHVAVEGTNLLGTTKVTFGTKSAHIKSITATKVVVTAPAHPAGHVQVVAHTATAQSATSKFSRYTYLPVPTVTGVSPGTGPEVGGTAVTITGTGFSHVRSVTFGGVKGHVTHHTTASISVTSPAHAATGSDVVVDVLVKTLGGTSAAVVADNFTYQATPPTPSCASCSCATCASCAACGACGSCASCAACGACGACAACASCGGCAAPETMTSLRRARAHGSRQVADRLHDARGRAISPLSRARSRGVGLRPVGNTGDERA
jgi:hypothetical protein